MDDARILTVTMLNEYVKMLIDGNPVLSRVYVKGEISNLTFHGSGHLYFSLKDETGRAAAVMFRSAAEKLAFRPENGMKVLVGGRVSVYTRDGAYQIYVSTLEPDGIGALAIAYEQLRRRLEAEGLFRQEIKKPIPKIPSAIGIVTSPTGAAIHDIMSVTGRRFPFAKLILYPALVQGEGAERDLVAGIEYFSASGTVDTVIIGRGGGSLEDLWAFNSETLARAIRRSRVPVISAVGHESDFTICDFASDVRAPTPSAAAEIAVPDQNELIRKFGNVTVRMETLLLARIKTARERVNQIASRRVLTDPAAYLDDKKMLLLSLSADLERETKRTLNDKTQKWKRLSSVLEAVSPLKVIAKGYSAVFAEDGRLIRSVSDVSVGDSVSFRTVDGTVGASVTEIREEKNSGS